MDDITKLAASIEATMRKAIADAYERGKADGKSELMAAINASVGASQVVRKRRGRKPKGE